MGFPEKSLFQVAKKTIFFGIRKIALINIHKLMLYVTLVVTTDKHFLVIVNMKQFL